MDRLIHSDMLLRGFSAMDSEIDKMRLAVGKRVKARSSFDKLKSLSVSSRASRDSYNAGKLSSRASR